MDLNTFIYNVVHIIIVYFSPSIVFKMKNSIQLLFLAFMSLAQAQTNTFPLLIGTYTSSCDSKGIYVYDFDANTGELMFKNATEKVQKVIVNRQKAAAIKLLLDIKKEYHISDVKETEKN